MTTYHATVERDDRYWFLRVDGIGVTQARHLGEAEHMAQDLVVCMLDLPGDTMDLDIDLDVRLPPMLRDRVHRALETRAALTKAATEASAALRDAAWSLADDGIAARDIGTLLGITRQRVQQLLAEREPAGRRSATPTRRGAGMRGMFAGQFMSIADDTEPFGTHADREPAPANLAGSSRQG